MEECQKKIILYKFTDLIQNTRCTAEFLSIFQEKFILRTSECQIIESKDSDSGKACKFYEIIQTRENAFPVLLEALEKCLQTGALSILNASGENLAEWKSIMEKANQVSEGRQDLISEKTFEEIQNPFANLSFEPTTDALQRRNISFDVVPPVFSFTGRTAELEQLHQMVLRSQGAERIAVVSQVTSVSGLGGIGKTQLAKEYVRLNGKEFDGNLLWMNAESEESLYDSFKRLAEGKLNLPVKDVMPAKCIAEAVYNYFAGMKALIVLDNAEKVPWLKQFMPRMENTQNLFFLITSRDREWDRGVEILSLDGLSEDEAVDLIQKGVEINESNPAQRESAQKLAQTLQCFPLALQQAIAYIYEQKRTSLDYSIDTYLEEFKTKQQELLSYREENAISVDIFTATTATTWSMTFDKLIQDPNNGELAILILNVVAYLRADNICRDLFYRLRLRNHWLTLKILNIASYFRMLNKRRYLLPTVCSIAETDSAKQDQTDTAVRLLVKYSMLNGGDGQSNLNVHRLVQTVTRNQLAQDGMEKTYLAMAIQLLQGSDDDDFPAENTGHALIVWRHASTYSQLIQNNAWQVIQILWKLREVGHHDEGIRFGKEALEKFKEVLGEDHLNCLWIQRFIGLILRDQGYVYNAISVVQDILTKAKSVFGEDSEISLLTKEDLVNLLSRSGKNQEALKILREVLEKKKTIFGDSHSKTLITEASYGVALLESGNLTEAEKVFQKIIEIYIENGDENSTKALNLQINLSSIYSIKGENEKALKIRRKVYERLSPVWTENVDLLAALCCHLAISLNKVGKYEEALKILEENIEKIKERLGSQHARTLVIQQAIGLSYRGLGNLSKALEILQSVHQSFVSLSGEDSLPSLSANTGVAITLSRLGQHSQALSKFQEILSKLEDLLGKENLETIRTKRYFALAIERSAENLHTALDLLKQAKAGMIPIVGEDSSHVEAISNDIKRIEKKTKTF